MKQHRRIARIFSITFTFIWHFSYLIVIAPRNKIPLTLSIQCVPCHATPFCFNTFKYGIYVHLASNWYNYCFPHVFFVPVFFSLSFGCWSFRMSFHTKHLNVWIWGSRRKDDPKKNRNCALWRMKFMPQFHLQLWAINEMNHLGIFLLCIQSEHTHTQHILDIFEAHYSLNWQQKVYYPHIWYNCNVEFPPMG